MRALVTGGGGFLGQALVRQLCARGAQVTSFSRRHYPHLADLGVVCQCGDLADAAAVQLAVANQDIVFHVAAKPGLWGPYQEFFNVNVLGTRHILDACRAHGVSRLVYTSSPSVIFNGQDMEGVDERIPYPAHFEAHYPRTKAQAEQEVLSANDATLATVALRPHLIWGPGDNHLLPRILQRARTGRLRKILSPGKPKRVDTIYVDNAAEAHLLAADRLAPGAPIAGKAYFLSQGEPVATWDFIDRILALANLPPLKKSISPTLALTVAQLCEWCYTLLPLSGEPPMTRFLARELATSHWFDISAARRDLGYTPRISIDAGLEELRRWLQTENVMQTYP